MAQFLIIPDKNNINESLALAKEYNVGFEYNDFFSPVMLDDKKALQECRFLEKGMRKLPGNPNLYREYV